METGAIFRNVRLLRKQDDSSSDSVTVNGDPKDCWFAPVDYRGVNLDLLLECWSTNHDRAGIGITLYKGIRRNTKERGNSEPPMVVGIPLQFDRSLIAIRNNPLRGDLSANGASSSNSVRSVIEVQSHAGWPFCVLYFIFN
jgi:hypothetical protein